MVKGDEDITSYWLKGDNDVVSDWVKEMRTSHPLVLIGGRGHDL